MRSGMVKCCNIKQKENVLRFLAFKKFYQNTNNVSKLTKTQGSKPAMRSGMVKYFKIAHFLDSPNIKILANNVEKQKNQYVYNHEKCIVQS